MGIFDVFTGNSAKEAAAKNAALYQQYGGQATGALNSGLASATGALDQGLTRSTDALTANTNHAYDTLGQGLKDQLAAYDQGQGQAVDAYGRASDAYTPLAALGSKYGGATSLLLDSYGVNGAAGNQRAVDAFQAGPGYDWARSQAIDAANRAAVSRGEAVGNTLAGVTDRATNMANQEYDNWRNGLSGFVSPELAATSGAASGQAGVLGNLASLYASGGAAKAGAIGNNASAGANLWNGLGTNLAGAYGNDANARAGLYSNNAQNLSNVYGNVASGQANSNTAAAQAAQQGSSQFWNSLINLGTAAAKAKT